MSDFDPETPLGISEARIKASTMSRERRLENIDLLRRLARPGNTAESLLAMHEARLAEEDNQ